MNWLKPASLFQSYLTEQNLQERLIWVAFYDNQFAGYVTLKWHSNYQFFNQQNIPEIKDLNILPLFINKRIGSALVDKCEEVASLKNSKVGLGIGLYADYEQAQQFM